MEPEADGTGGELQLSARQRGALEAICDTFAPGGEGLPSASELGVPEALLGAAAMNPRATERKQFAQLLGLWDKPGLTALGGGGFTRFSELPLEKREKVLLSWRDSRLPQRRATFEALRKGTLLMHYMLHDEQGGSAVFEQIGYPGAIGAPDEPPPKRIRPLEVSGDTVLDCDVCVVGSGAGGGTAAAVLAAAGLDVVVLEAGGYFSEEDFDGDQLSGFANLYLQGGGMATHDQSVGLLAGACLGGGTLVNFAYCFRTPDDVREEWAGLGVPAFASDEYTRSLDAVWERLGVNEEHNTPSSRDQTLHRGLTELGWHVDSIPRTVAGCQEEVCGYCGWGCPLGAKQSTMKTWLQDAHDKGARVLVGTRAERVLAAGGAARGVQARTAQGERVTVRSRAVVAACGAIQTPPLLKRSGLANQSVGRHLRLHPAAGIWGVFDEELRPWEGMTGTVYSDEHRYLEGGYGVKYEHIPCHPYLYVAYGPWSGGRAFADYRRAMSHTMPVGILMRDHGGGEVRVGRDGEPEVRYRLSDL
ncbi:MAG TPA: GMC family oxidoreductase N-terminal domain-containing protein, partial [Thermoleophilaceae bacterium]|nr:GMC family oxidoreductase N-terminal domain-containing protein [Thermoleophilaceae bacterium]